jgi:predicted AlkP superfamily phosphohydrolase/phosphomutase
MPAFVLPSFGDAHIRLNVVGREASGVVAPEDYVRVCDEVEQFVRACVSGRTRCPVVADVWRPRAADAFDPDAPDADLVVSFSEDADALEHPDVGSVGPMPVPRTGGHSNRGFALFVGPGIGAGHVHDGRLVDLPTTLLTLADASPTREMDGTPLVHPDRVAAG